MLYLAVCAPLVWALAFAFSLDRTRHEVDELFDTELIRLARQLQASVASPSVAQAPPPVRPSRDAGSADLRDLAVAVWDAQGRLLANDREGAQLRRLPAASGFVEDTIGGERWRVYYLQAADSSRQVAAGQKAAERDEVVSGLVLSQLVPWLLMLPVLLAAMAWGVRRALSPLNTLSRQLAQRRADDLAPLPARSVPAELRPLVTAMDGLFSRISELLARERRFTADAAHELRTPIAFLRMQWDVLRQLQGPQRQLAEAKFEGGLDRLERLVTQLLTLSRADAADAARLTTEVDWRAAVEQVVNDVLPLLRRRRIELACEWPPADRPALPLLGDTEWVAALLRNLVDNAARYAPQGSTVTLRMQRGSIEVENEAPGAAPETLSQLGARFTRPAGQQESGSGLGVSIARRIAEVHGLALEYDSEAPGRVRAVLRHR
nr:ATP-binding protein [Ramlibacter aurantiacus]